MLSPIFDSFNRDRSRSGNTDQCVNIYPEDIDGPKGPEIGLLISVPGKRLLGTIGPGPIRGMYEGNDGLMYVVSGAGVYSATTGYAGTLLGTIDSSSGAVSIINSPTQILVVDGTGGWVWDRVALTFTKTIENAGTDCVNPTAAIYQDGFGIVNSDDNQIYQTNYNDLAAMTSGSPATANNAYVQNSSKNVVTLFDLKEEVWIFKEDSIEIWINQGAAGFAFTPLQGVSIPVGCSALASVAQLGESIAWLGGSEQGNGVVYMSVGYQAVPITTPALSTRFQNFSSLSDAVAWGYQKDGHYFYVITFPIEGESWAYDLKTKKWHRRAGFNNGVMTRDIANCSVFFNGLNIVGDYQNGNIYALDNEVFTDNGMNRKWVRSWRALPSSMPQGVPMSFDSLQILLETGITVPAGTNPQIMLRWSDDGGYTWTQEFQVQMGKTGETSWRAIKIRCGSTKIGTGMDRIWEISGVDPVEIKITGATFEGGPA